MMAGMENPNRLEMGIPADIVNRLGVLAALHGRSIDSEVRWVLRAHVIQPGRLHDLIGANGSEDQFDSYVAGQDLTGAGVTYHERQP